MVVDGEGQIPNDVYDYGLGELFDSYRKAMDLEMQELAKLVKDRQTFPWKTKRQAKCKE